MIKNNRGSLPINAACKILNVCTKGYYKWLKRPSESLDVTGARVARIFHESNGIYGVRRIQKKLIAEGFSVSRYSIRKRMWKYNLVAKAAKKFKATTNSKHNLPFCPNLLAQNFYASKPDTAWVTDFTYIWTGEGWLYLAVMIDLYSRRIVGWSISDRMTKKLVIEALLMAIRRRKQKTELIIHSDRGSQYCSREYQALIRKHGFSCSMSK